MKFFEYLLLEANYEYTAIMVYYIISDLVCLAALLVDRVLGRRLGCRRFT